MRPLLFLAVLLSVSGCDSTGTSDYSQYYQAVRQSVAGSFGGNTHVTKDQAAAISYASIGYRVNDGPEQLLVLATDSGGEQLWTSAAHVVIVTRGGRIVRTVGLSHDLAAVTPQRGQQLSLPADATSRSLTTTRLEDFPNIPIYGAAVKCTASPQGPETIVLLGRGVTTIKVNETCSSNVLDWSFTDSYWVDPQNSLVWRSIQHVSPKGEKVEVETLRPPG
jgi:hypothetical protein